MTQVMTSTSLADVVGLAIQSSLVVLASIAFLQPPSAWAGNNSGRMPISHFKISSSRIVVYFSGGSTALDDARCTSTDQSPGVAIESSLEGYSELLAAVMLAHGENRQIGF